MFPPLLCTLKSLSNFVASHRQGKFLASCTDMLTCFLVPTHIFSLHCLHKHHNIIIKSQVFSLKKPEITSKEKLSKPEYSSHICFTLSQPRKTCCSFSKFVWQCRQIYVHGTYLCWSLSRVGRHPSPISTKKSSPFMKFVSFMHSSKSYILRYQWESPLHIDKLTWRYKHLYY